MACDLLAVIFASVNTRTDDAGGATASTRDRLRGEAGATISTGGQLRAQHLALFMAADQRIGVSRRANVELWPTNCEHVSVVS